MSYPGSKGQAGTWQRIIGQMPPHSVYVEPFFGSGEVFFRKRLAVRNVVNDVAAGVIETARETIMTRPDCRHGKGTDLFIQSTRFQFFNSDTVKLLPILALPADALVYCDPPYLLQTRRNRRYYEHEMTDQDHAALLSALVAMKCRVLLSGYPSELYSSTLRDWRCLSYRARTRGKTVTECLWCNFPEPTELHDWRYAGKNFRQRTSFKRLAARWLAKLDGMTPLKRGYVLNAISQRQSQRVPRSTPDSARGTVTPDLTCGAGDEQFYCPKHRYNPQANSGFCFCPKCELES